MRILHTSDWHVGRTLHGQDLLAEQAMVLGELADIVFFGFVFPTLVAGLWGDWKGGFFFAGAGRLCFVHHVRFSSFFFI